jgi:N4-gp56 family major capsid protein
MLLSGDGIQGDGTLEGNEEALTTYTDDVFIDQLRHAVRSGGKMSEQRIPFSVREEARMGLEDWWADRIDTWFMTQLSGTFHNQTGSSYQRTGLQAPLAPSTNRIVFPADTTTEASISESLSAFMMTTAVIDDLVRVAKTVTPQIRPIRVGGDDYFVMFLHPYQVHDLRRDTANLGWGDIQKSAMSGGDVANNPIFTGALGVYNGVILHESTRVPAGGSATGSGSLSNVRRAIFCGAQALSMAYGRGFGGNRMSWVEELFDYRNQLGVSAGLIGGMKKMQFNSEDFGVLVRPTSITTAFTG